MLLHNINGSKVLDRSMLDSFVVYIALNGSVRIVADGEVETLDEGEVILIPAEISEITIDSIGGDAKLMEVYIDK
jgi:mannose-6-phosphate isomerase